MDKFRILLADDDLIFLKLTTQLLENAGYQVETAAGVEAAYEQLRTGKHDIMMLDMRFPALHDGFEVLSEVHERHPNLPVLMISGSGHIPDAVLAIKNGAVDFIEKPLESNQLLIKLQRITETISAKRELHAMQVAAIGMRGKSAAMEALYRDIVQSARFDCPVLITGETGVGKELAAGAIHRLSRYAAKNMISLNCASIPKDLFEAELFGYERGAFTGADKARSGYFEFANNNSLFLDEISQLPMAVQAKLLRVISEGEIQKLGGKVLKVETRIISASNMDLALMMEENSFRADLFYRLNTIHIKIPPLRKRTEDIPDLADYFMAQFCAKNDLQPKPISPAAMAWLCEQNWPGNVRELKNCIERAVVFAKNDHLSVVDFTMNNEDEQNGLETGSLRTAIASFEKAYIENVLRAYGYNIRQAAFYLQMDKSNLFKKIATLKIVLPGK